MSERIETFEIGETVRVIAATRSGDITVVSGDPGSVKLVIDGSGADLFEVDQLGDVISIEHRRKGRFLGSSADVTLKVPPSASLELSCSSGDINVQSSVVELRASVASGDVRVDSVQTTCKVNTASGDTRIGSALDAEINTASGTVRLGSIGRNLRVNAASGNVYVDEVGESAIFKVASSDVRIGSFLGTEIRHKAVSGDLHLGIPPRRTIEMDFSSMSGRMRNKLPKGDGSPTEKLVSVSIASVSGDVTMLGAGI